ncbi:MAG: dCTP deaminase [Deltaproteobacteria bacterium]|nr:MAG: dCTP deaminase [Deltaproteobacteria bacterium]
MILGRSAILKAINNGEIKIEPFDEKYLGPASYDLHLSNAFRVFKLGRRVMKVTDNLDFKAFTQGVWVPDGESLLLMPGQTVLGITLEKITLAPYIAGWLEGRSRFARAGLLVHVSASFMHPGISNHQVLELSNVGQDPLELYPHTVVCQFIFERIEGEGVYRGVFRTQTPESFWKD